MISDIQKTIYNWYIRALRSRNDKPFRYRKNFDNIENDKCYPYLVKLETFFSKYPHFLRKEFFEAPYHVYQDVKKYFGLDFYASMKGMATCMAYFKLLQQQNPDDQIDFIRESLKFIGQFCEEHNLMFSEYIRYKSIAQNDCLKHLKNHQISWYLVPAIPGFVELIQDMPRDEFILYFGSDIDLMQIITTYNNSTIARNFIQQKTRFLEQFLLNKLKQRYK
jgi:hypothetical protein